MSRALSLDLRIRVLSAVRAGMSHRATGARFGVSAASVSRWCALEREQGDARPKALGGDRRSGRIEAQRGVILSLLEMLWGGRRESWHQVALCYQQKETVPCQIRPL